MVWASDWWLSELERDPSYSRVVTPLLVEILDARPGRSYLDLGCGEGQTMRALDEMGISVIGCDLDETLLPIAHKVGPVVRCELPELSWLRDVACDGAYASLVIEHLNDAATLFREAHRVVRPGGVLAIVINHPVFAAPRPVRSSIPTTVRCSGGGAGTCPAEGSSNRRGRPTSRSTSDHWPSS